MSPHRRQRSRVQRACAGQPGAIGPWKQKANLSSKFLCIAVQNECSNHRDTRQASSIFHKENLLGRMVSNPWRTRPKSQKELSALPADSRYKDRARLCTIPNITNGLYPRIHSRDDPVRNNSVYFLCHPPQKRKLQTLLKACGGPGIGVRRRHSREDNCFRSRFRACTGAFTFPKG